MMHTTADDDESDVWSEWSSFSLLTSWMGEMRNERNSLPTDLAELFFENDSHDGD